MIADFLEPFWEFLFEKTGVFGLFIASFSPVILIVLLLLIIVVTVRIFGSSKKKNLHKIYEKAMNLEVDCRYNEAWKLYTKYAKKAPPSAEAFYHMGMFCISAKEDGWEYSKGDARPSYWFEKAAAYGHNPAKFQLLKIEFGKNFSSDLLECAKIIKEIKKPSLIRLPEAARFLTETEELLFKKADAGIIEKNEALSVLGNSENQFLLAKGLLKQKKDKDAIGWLIFSADNGYVDSQLVIADLYRVGGRDNLVRKDPQKAFEYFKKAADNGNGKAATALGEMYYTGEGCEKNLLEAARSFAKAADNDKNPTSAHNAAVCYYQYANECVDKKGITDPIDRKLDGQFMTYTMSGNEYSELARKLGYKKS